MLVRVAVVADSPMFRAGLEAMLGADHGLTVVGAVAEPHDDASSGALAAMDADVVVWVRSDASMAADAPPDDGYRRDGAPDVVLLANLAGRDAARRALADGVRALLPLDAEGDAVLAAVHAVAAGLVALPPDLLADALAREAVPVAARDIPRDGAVSLTPREREVLALLGQGLANKAIAPRLGITEHTVKAHVASIYEKLGAGNRAEVVMAAARAGLLLL